MAGPSRRPRKDRMLFVSVDSEGGDETWLPVSGSGAQELRDDASLEQSISS